MSIDLTRDRELNILQQAISSTCEGSGASILLTG
ncbi:MAG: hypothetical protein ACI8PG_002630 [Planctomycetota bacterium]|jgi:hypothetical protein